MNSLTHYNRRLASLVAEFLIYELKKECDVLEDVRQVRNLQMTRNKYGLRLSDFDRLKGCLIRHLSDGMSKFVKNERGFYIIFFDTCLSQYIENAVGEFSKTYRKFKFNNETYNNYQKIDIVAVKAMGFEVTLNYKRATESEAWKKILKWKVYLGNPVPELMGASISLDIGSFQDENDEDDRDETPKYELEEYFNI